MDKIGSHRPCLYRTGLMGGRFSHLEGGQPLPEGLPVLPGGYRHGSVVQVVTYSNLGQTGRFLAPPAISCE